MTRSRLVVAFALAFLILQVGVPSFRLLEDRRPVAFGWQMYAGLPDRYEYELVLPEDGSSPAAGPDTSAHPPYPLFRRPVEVEDHVVRRRWEIDFRESLRDVLCRENPEALAIAARESGSGKGEWVFPCP